ncbi:uncharacterized protein LOC130670311 [Microplitis mediator]|uniref:uncharacterized protein LOC130670311 n=1 Tax=Microplitis mediator TaxID=375433 RepID=UPI002557A5AA|nr:uncharacterized protein LOC130670311 [Microplitis mediator]
MNLVIDFHGYKISEYENVLKELAIVSLETDGNDMIIDEHYLFKPALEWENLSKDYQEIYAMLFKVHGISWKKGLLNYESQKSILIENLKKAAYVYLFNLNSKEFLNEIVDNIEEYKIIYLDDLDYYEHEDEFQTKCKYHKNKNKNNCARDNVLKMRDWILSNRCLVKNNNTNNQPHCRC